MSEEILDQFTDRICKLRYPVSRENVRAIVEAAITQSLSAANLAKENAERDSINECWHIEVQSLEKKLETLTKECDDAANSISSLSTRIASTDRLQKLTEDNLARWMEKHQSAQQERDLANKRAEELENKLGFSNACDDILKMSDGDLVKAIDEVNPKQGEEGDEILCPICHGSGFVFGTVCSGCCNGFVLVDQTAKPDDQAAEFERYWEAIGRETAEQSCAAMREAIQRIVDLADKASRAELQNRISDAYCYWKEFNEVVKQAISIPSSGLWVRREVLYNLFQAVLKCDPQLSHAMNAAEASLHNK